MSAVKMCSPKFYSCKCFYYSNIFLKDYKIHVTYKNTKQFLAEYSEILKTYGCKDPASVIPEIEGEIERRRAIPVDSIARRKEIKKKYQPLHPEVYELNKSFLAPEFLALSELCQKKSTTATTLKQHLTEHKYRVYSFPMFSNEFCSKLRKEMENFEASELPKGRPNSMNRYGIILGELGFDERLLSPLRTKYLQPICSKLYPDWGNGELDSHYAFTVMYRIGQDADLDYHYDNAEVTLNVSLNPNSEYTGGELYFGHMKNELDDEQRFGYWHKNGWGVLHRGQHLHGAMPIESGERCNLILWLRSSKVRNRTCPLCGEKPDLEPVEKGWGGGFTSK